MMMMNEEVLECNKILESITESQKKDKAFWKRQMAEFPYEMRGKNTKQELFDFAKKIGLEINQTGTMTKIKAAILSAMKEKMDAASGVVSEDGVSAGSSKPAIMIRTAGTKPLPYADFKMPAGSKLRLVDVEMNEKDGVLFSDDEEDFKIITKMTAGNVEGSVVQIGQKEYPVLAIQKMGSSSKWNFILDYDENEPKPVIQKKNKYEKM